MTESGYDASFASWEEAMEQMNGEIRSGSELIFRADHLSLPELRCSFDSEAERAGIDNSERWKYEAWILREFIRRAYHYLPSSQLPANEDKLEWLSLMRHYKAPSRLLDFTHSFPVALYFAMRGSTWSGTEQSCCVWVADSKWLLRESEEIFRNWLQRNDYPDHLKTPHLRQPEMFTKFFLDHSLPERCVIPITPFRMNERITRQRGLFLCSGDISVPFHENLKKMSGHEGRVRRIVMPADKESLRRVFRYFRRRTSVPRPFFPTSVGMPNHWWRRFTDLKSSRTRKTFTVSRRQ